MRIEIRGNQVLLDGYVNAVARDSRVLPSPRGRFVEQIKPKTFERALQKADDVELRFNHDPNRKLGSIKEGNLQLYEDNIGLRAIATVSDDKVIEKAKNGELRGWSFGFIDNKPNWEDGEDGIQKRYLEDIDLLEVSILDKTPAYIATSIEARGEESCVSEQRSEEFSATIETRDIGEKRIKGIYHHMINRCYNKDDVSYPNYGARGVKVCEEWKNDMESFVQWSKDNGYSDEKSIDRIDTDGDYKPSNCRWATDTEQNNNKRNNKSEKRDISYTLYEREVEFLKLKGGK